MTRAVTSQSDVTRAHGPNFFRRVLHPEDDFSSIYKLGVVEEEEEGTSGERGGSGGATGVDSTAS